MKDAASKVTEVSCKRGRRWVYGPLDPSRPIEIKWPETEGPDAELKAFLEQMNKLHGWCR